MNSPKSNRPILAAAEDDNAAVVMETPPSLNTSLTVIHYIFMLTTALTMLDCVWQLLMVAASPTIPQPVTSPISAILPAGSYVWWSTLTVIRFLSSALAFMALALWGVRANRAGFLVGHTGYFVLTYALVFVIGCHLNYQLFVWSLVLQITHSYLSMVYTFKLFLAHMFSQECRPAADYGAYGRTLFFINENLMAISTVLMVMESVLLAVLLRNTVVNPWSPRQLMRMKFVGEIFIRVLLSLIVPLIGTSIAQACTGFDTRFSGRIMVEIIIYYTATTTLAVIEGLVMVTLIAPGKKIRNNTAEAAATAISATINKRPSPTMRPSRLIEDTLLDMVRNLFSDNLFRSWMSTYRTKLYWPPDAANLTEDRALVLGEEVPGANIMSVVVLGLLVGITAATIRTRGGRTLTDLIETTNQIVMMVTMVIVQVAPLCTVFLIVPQVLAAEDLTETFGMVGWFTITVLVSLAFHCFVTLSGIYIFFARKNPYRFLAQMLPAVSTAFATSSSSAAMMVTMNCLEEKAGINPGVVRFVVPFGSTVNMDGAALYEAVAAIFVAQYRRVSLNLANLITIAITAILVSIGAAGIPQAGMITTVVVLNSIGLSLEDAALVMVVDFLLDRFRTVVNVLGDAFGAAVVSIRLRHLLNRRKSADSQRQLRPSSSLVVASVRPISASAGGGLPPPPPAPPEGPVPPPSASQS